MHNIKFLLESDVKLTNNWVKKIKTNNQLQTNKKNHRLSTVDRNYLKPVVSKYHQTDVLYSDCQDIINPRFRDWYLKTFYRLGRQTVLRLAKIARADGNDPARLFSYFLRRELCERYAIAS